MRWIWRRRWLFVLLGVPGLVVRGFVGFVLWGLSDLFKEREFILPIHDGEITEADAMGLLEYRELAARLEGLVPQEDSRARPGSRYWLQSGGPDRLVAWFVGEHRNTECVSISRRPGDAERGQVHVFIYQPH